LGIFASIRPATTIVTQARPAATRKLGKMDGNAAGRTILRNRSHGPAPSEVAASRYTRGTPRTPWCAPRNVITATLVAMSSTFEVSPYPNQTTYSGKSARAGVKRKNVNQG